MSCGGQEGDRVASLGARPEMCGVLLWGCLEATRRSKAKLKSQRTSPRWKRVCPAPRLWPREGRGAGPAGPFVQILSISRWQHQSLKSSLVLKVGLALGSGSRVGGRRAQRGYRDLSSCSTSCPQTSGGC